VSTAERVAVTGLLPPIPPPFKDGRVDSESLRRVVNDLHGHVDGILVGGSVGETPSLTVTERIEVMRTVAEELHGDAFLVVSIADNSITNTHLLAEAAAEVGAQLLMLSCPNYYENNLAMLTAYLGAVAEFTAIDLGLYDNPIATHTTLSVDDIVAIAAAVPSLTHAKITDTSLGKVTALRERTDLVLHAGDDAVLWHQLSSGVHGAMVAMPMIYPEATRELWRHFADGDTETASDLYVRMARFTHLSLGAPDYVPVIKAVLHHRGVIASPEVRVPLVELSPSRHAEVMASL
jgi:4-hydroxy-tetrahydrodipicolinate synthase